MPVHHDVTRLGNEFVIHFGGLQHQVNAVTCGRSLPLPPLIALNRRLMPAAVAAFVVAMEDHNSAKQTREPLKDFDPLKLAQVAMAGTTATSSLSAHSSFVIESTMSPDVRFVVASSMAKPK